MRGQKEFKQLHTHIDRKFDDFEALMISVEKYQAEQMRRWAKSKNNPLNYDAKTRDGNNRSKNWNYNRGDRGDNQQNGNNQRNSSS